MGIKFFGQGKYLYSEGRRRESAGMVALTNVARMRISNAGSGMIGGRMMPWDLFKPPETRETALGSVIKAIGQRRASDYCSI